jgi:hypothetical protein
MAVTQAQVYLFTGLSWAMLGLGALIALVEGAAPR